MAPAAECFKKAYLADTRNLGALENLIELLIRAGRHEPAGALASQWTRSHPRCARAWIARAKLNLLAGEIASARTALATALEIDPANAAVQSALESLGSETRGDPAPQAAPRAPRPESPLPFLRPLGPISKAPARSDPPVLCVGAALHPGGYSHWTKQTVLWLRRAGMRVGLDKYAGETADSYLRALDISELRDLRGALEERVRDGVLVMHPSAGARRRQRGHLRARALAVPAATGVRRPDHVRDRRPPEALGRALPRHGRDLGAQRRSTSPSSRAAAWTSASSGRRDSAWTRRSTSRAAPSRCPSAGAGGSCS